MFNVLPFVKIYSRTFVGMYGIGKWIQVFFVQLWVAILIGVLHIM